MRRVRRVPHSERRVRRRTVLRRLRLLSQERVELRGGVFARRRRWADALASSSRLFSPSNLVPSARIHVGNPRCPRRRDGVPASIRPGNTPRTECPRPRRTSPSDPRSASTNWSPFRPLTLQKLREIGANTPLDLASIVGGYTATQNPSRSRQRRPRGRARGEPQDSHRVQRNRRGAPLARLALSPKINRGDGGMAAEVRR